MSDRPKWIDGHTAFCRVKNIDVGKSCSCGHGGLRAYAIPEGVCGELEVIEGKPHWRTQPTVSDVVKVEAWERLREEYQAYRYNGQTTPPDGRYWLLERRCPSCGYLESDDAIHMDHLRHCEQVTGDKWYYELVRQDAEPLTLTRVTSLELGVHAECRREDGSAWMSEFAPGRSILFVSGAGERWVQSP